ncbi:hypothetical protein [Micromonospora rubida]
MDVFEREVPRGARVALSLIDAPTISGRVVNPQLAPRVRNVATCENVDHGHPKNCTDGDHLSHSVACWQPYGVVLWISDNSTLYRQGTCTCTFTSNGWGYRKDMYEGSLIKLRVCDSPDFRNGGRESCSTGAVMSSAAPAADEAPSGR